MFSVLIKSKGTISKEAGKNISPRTDYFINFFFVFFKIFVRTKLVVGYKCTPNFVLRQEI